MIKVAKFLLLSMFCLLVTSFSFANTDENFFTFNSRIQTEKQAVTEYITQTSHKKITDKEVTSIVDIVYDTALKQDMNPLFLLAMIKKESGFNKDAISPYGARGLMQVVPRYHHDKLKGRNPHNNKVSIEVGTIIFKDCLNTNKNNLTLALKCYSGGASKKYNLAIRKTHDEMKRHIVVHQFSNEKEITTAYSYTVPVSKSAFNPVKDVRFFALVN